MGVVRVPAMWQVCKSYRPGFVLLVGCAVTLVTGDPGHAIRLSRDYFASHGGDLNDIPNTLFDVMQPLRRESMALQFGAIVRQVANGCTATWLGNSADGTRSFFLTAKHCVNGQETVNQFGTRYLHDRLAIDPVTGAEIWTEEEVARGNGISYVLPEQAGRPAEPNMDIAIVEVDYQSVLVMADGTPVAKPRIYIGRNEANKPVTLVGTGLWGVGQMDISISVPYGPRRSMGLSEARTTANGVTASFDAQGGEASGHWGGTRSGDSGSAWWQNQGGVWAIIADTYGSSTNNSMGPRASSYWQWIRSIYPDALFYDYRDQATTESVTDVFDNLLLQAAVPGSLGSDSVSVAPKGELWVVENLVLDGSHLLNSGIVIAKAGKTQRVRSLNGMGELTLEDNAIVIVDNAASTPSSYGGIIRGNGSLVKRGQGTLSLTESNTYLGETRLEEGTLEVSRDSNLGDESSRLTLAGGVFRTLQSFLSSRPVTIESTSGQIDTISDLTLKGPIDGSGSLTKTGAGFLTLAGSGEAFTGTLKVAESALNVTGNLPQSRIEVAHGAQLRGTGRVGSLLVEGQLAPGSLAGGGVLSSSGDVILSPGSSFLVMGDGSGALSQLNADGSVHVNGAMLQVMASGIPFQDGQVYPVIFAGGGVTGAFSGITSDLLFFTPEIQQEIGVVKLLLKRNNTAFDEILTQPNARAAARAVEGLSAADPLYRAILSSNQAELISAFAMLPGDIHPGMRTALVSHTHRLSQPVRDRLSTITDTPDLRLGSQCSGWPGDGVSSIAVGGVLYRCGDGVAVAWGEAFSTQSSHRAGLSGATSLSTNTSGFVGGIDNTVGSSWRLGLAGSYSTGSTLSTLPATGSFTSWSGTLYGALALEELYLGGGISHSTHRIAVERSVHLPTLSEHLTSSYSGRTGQFFGEAGYMRTIGRMTLTPFAGIALNLTRTASFVENGGSTAVRARSAGQHAVSSALGLRGKSDIVVGETSLVSVEGSIGWDINLAGRDTTNEHRFADSANAFHARGVKLPRFPLLIEVGVGMAIGEGTKLDLNYSGTWSGDHPSNTVRGALSTKF